MTSGIRSTFNDIIKETNPWKNYNLENILNENREYIDSELYNDIRKLVKDVSDVEYRKVIKAVLEERKEEIEEGIKKYTNRIVTEKMNDFISKL